jgi:hypothetical protein
MEREGSCIEIFQISLVLNARMRESWNWKIRMKTRLVENSLFGLDVVCVVCVRVAGWQKVVVVVAHSSWLQLKLWWVAWGQREREEGTSRQGAQLLDPVPRRHPSASPAPPPAPRLMHTSHAHTLLSSLPQLLLFFIWRKMHFKPELRAEQPFSSAVTGNTSGLAPAGRHKVTGPSAETQT